MSASTTPVRDSPANGPDAEVGGPDAELALASAGARLAAARRGRGVTLAVIAGRCGLSPAYVSQIESGAANPTLRALLQLASAVGLHPDDLFATDRREPHRADADFAPRRSRAALTHGAAGTPGIWDHTAPGAGRLVARLVHGDAADHASPTMHPGEEYVLVVHGSCRLRVGDTEYDLGPGDACHFPAGVEHHLHDASADLMLSVVMSAS